MPVTHMADAVTPRRACLEPRGEPNMCVCVTLGGEEPGVNWLVGALRYYIYELSSKNVSQLQVGTGR